MKIVLVPMYMRKGMNSYVVSIWNEWKKKDPYFLSRRWWKHEALCEFFSLINNFPRLAWKNFHGYIHAYFGVIGQMCYGAAHHGLGLCK